MFTLIKAWFFLTQLHATVACTFTRTAEDFLATVKYEVLSESQELCLQSCFEESDCTFIDYTGNICTVYKNGSTAQLGRDNAFKIDRTFSNSSCKKTIPVAQKINFQKIVANYNKQAGWSCNGAPQLTTIINTFAKPNGVSSMFFFTTKGSFFPNGNAPIKSMVFARDRQPNCTSVPVFTTASRRRLYFGDAYNVTGYIFLNAFAFADECSCEDGSCCGKKTMAELTIGGDHIYASASTPGTEVDQIFYVVSVDDEYDYYY